MDIVNFLIASSSIVDAQHVPTPPCDDPEDVMFLQAAIASKAKYLVSGDKYLLDVGKYPGGIVLKVHDFLSAILNK